MKVAISLILLFTSTFLTAGLPVYSEGDQLTVIARSGLHLRMEPSVNGRVLRTLKYGDQVCIERMFQAEDTLRQRIGWTNGRWVLVSYLGTEGYLFDGYLSSLPLPNHESQLCIDCISLTQPVTEYIQSHFKELGMENRGGGDDTATETVLTFENGIFISFQSNTRWTHTEIVFHEQSLNEVMGILRSTLVGNDQRNAFEAGLIFRENENDIVDKIISRGLGNELRITEHEDGSVSLVSWVPVQTDGC